jgi:uncharacterized protein
VISINERLAKELNILLPAVDAVVAMLDEGNTIPFIARYRKEAHGSLDDQLLRALADRLVSLRNLEKRRAEVTESIVSQDKMTDELAFAIAEALTITELEDLYRPYRPKRKTRASVARERGLQPLADIIFAQELVEGDWNEIALEFLRPGEGVETIEDALAGACDIIAEIISDDAQVRKDLRETMHRQSQMKSSSDKAEGTVYQTYKEFHEPVTRLQSHQILALNRGESEGILTVNLDFSEDLAFQYLFGEFVIEGTLSSEMMKNTSMDAWKRLLAPSLEREIRNQLTEAAQEQAIKTFSLNLRPLLMQSPLKGQVVMGLDPGYRTGCKVAVVDATGKILDTGVAYITHGAKGEEDSARLLSGMIRKHHVTAISIGNGTASRETEAFTAKLIASLKLKIGYMVVSEAGASVYSASKLAAEEFPEFDLTLRSAISIARRLQDPLAELVKIDPKSIGVGQYQHDMPQARLSESLDGVVEDCVNAVGVDVNTASAPLLTRVAGIGNSLAKNIVVYREDNGPFASRKALTKVPKLGKKAYEQAAGFLRIPDSANVLDRTAVHPESYTAAEHLLALCSYDKIENQTVAFADLSERIRELGEGDVAKTLGIGIPTLRDIVTELKKPGRDIRDELPAPLLRSEALSLEELKPGMKITGTVRNVVDFGIFVDIGVHQDGLVHISRASKQYIKHPSQVCAVGDIKDVWVLEVEASRKRISLSFFPPAEEPPAPKAE